MSLYSKPNENDHQFMEAAMEQARESLKTGGIPIGACLVKDGKVIAKGHNQRVQKSNPILHGEMDCLQKAGRLTAKDYKNTVLYTTLSPCDMCSGAILLFKIPRVVLAENKNFKGNEDYLKQRGVELVNLDLPEAVQMMKEFIEKNSLLWDEDIAE